MPAETHSPPRPDRRRRRRAHRARAARRDPRGRPRRRHARRRLRAKTSTPTTRADRARRGVKAELGERMVGFAIDDEDLVDWQTVARRGRVRRRRPRARERARRMTARIADATDAARRGGAADRLEALAARARVHASTTTTLLASLAHRSWCAEHGEPESNERLEFLGDSVLGLVVTHYVFEHFPHAARRPARRRCARRGERAVLAELAQELDLGAPSAPRQGRGRRRRARQAVDPRRRVRGGGRRGVSRRGLVAAPATSCCAASRERIAEAGAGPGGRDYKTRLQELPRPACARAAPVRQVRDEGPDHAKHSSPRCTSATSATARARAVEEEAEQAAAWVAWTRLQDEASRRRRRRPAGTGERGRRCRSYLRSRSCAATSNARSSARRSSRSRSPARARSGGTRTRRSSSTRSTAARSSRVQRRGKYLVMQPRRRRRARRAPRHVGSAAAREDRAGEGAEAHARRDHVHPGRPVALRRSAHVRRDVRDGVRRDRAAGRRARAPRARSARDRDVVGLFGRMLARAQDQVEAAADGPEVHRRHRQRLQRRDPVRGRAQMGPHERLALAAGDPAPVPRDHARRCRTR